MSDYRRARSPGGAYFFTHVTLHRRPILTQASALDALRSAIEAARKTKPFVIDAIVVLPDHLHCILVLPTGDADFAGRWKAIKARFSRLMPQELESPTRRDRERGFWQRRYWEHLIRDDEDWNRHRDYIHYNPVKHGLAAAAIDWPHSSFHRYVAQGLYSREWGEIKESGQDFGE